MTEPARVPHVLYLVHSLPPEEQSGSPLTTVGYARSLAARGYRVTVMSAASPAAPASVWPPAVVRRPGEAFDRVAVPPTSSLGHAWSINAASDPFGTGTGQMRELLRHLRPDLLHVVNNVNLPLAWPEVAKAEGIAVVRSVTCAEDLCAHIAPVSVRSGPAGFCSAPLTPDQCAACVVATVGPDFVPDSGLTEEHDSGPSDPADHEHLPGDGPEGWTVAGFRSLVARLERKRSRAVEQFDHAYDRVVFATEGFRRYFEQTIALDPARVRVIGMGMDTTDWTGFTRTRTVPGPGTPLVFCLAGTLHSTKGVGALANAFTSPELLERDDYRLDFIGGGDETLIASLVAANPRIRVRGTYDAEQLPALLDEMDVGLATSVFETFHRVSREYLLAGLPVVGSHAFGIPDIVHHGINGLLFEASEPDGLVRAVTALLGDRALVARLGEGAAATRVRTVDDEADDLAALYDEVLADKAGRAGMPGALAGAAGAAGVAGAATSQVRARLLPVWLRRAGSRGRLPPR